MITANQTREALVLLRWTPLTLATRAFLPLDDVTRAFDDDDVRRLGGLQLGAIREAFEAAGVETLDHGEPGVRLITTEGRRRVES